MVRPGDLRWTSLRRPAAEFASPRGDGWDLTMRPSTLAEPVTPAFLGLWIGVCATSNGRPTATIAQVERFEYLPVGTPWCP